MLATDPYGKYLPGPHGLPQYVCDGNCIVTGVDTGSPSLEGDTRLPCRSRTTCVTSRRRS